jgi:hypothetical protein
MGSNRDGKRTKRMTRMITQTRPTMLASNRAHNIMDDKAPTPSLTSNCLWGGWQMLEADDMDGEHQAPMRTTKDTMTTS